MTKKDKLISRLLSVPKDFTYEEAKTLCQSLGLAENNKGKTSGSRVVFKNADGVPVVILHKPHPSNVLKTYQVKDLINDLQREGLI